MAEEVGEKRPAATIWTATLLMVTFFLCLSGQLMLHSTLFSEGVNPTVLVFYSQAIASVILSSLAYILERHKNPSFSFRFLAWTFFLGFLQIPLSNLILAASLRYVSPSFQGSLLNTIPAAIYILAITAGRERFSICRVIGQAKLWGTIISVSGAILVAISKDSAAAAAQPLSDSGGRVIGVLMVVTGVLAGATFNIIVEIVAEEYAADMTLTALMTVFGTLQTLVYAAITEGGNSAAWRISGGGEVFVILYSGLLVTGIFHYVSTWCIHKMGPIFTGAFSPLLTVFSMVLETIFRHASPQPRCLAGSIVVAAGMYLILWAKSKEYAELVPVKGGGAAAEAPLLEEERAP